MTDQTLNIKVRNCAKVSAIVLRIVTDSTESAFYPCVCVYRTRAVFVEFSLYSINTNLLAVFSFLFEFPVSERAQSSLDLFVVTLWPITGLDLQLLLTVRPLVRSL